MAGSRAFLGQQTSQEEISMFRMQAIVLGEICRVLETRVSQVDLDGSFISLGGDSLSAISLVSACRYHGFDMSAQSILTSKDIRELLERSVLSASPSASARLLLSIKGPSEALSYVKNLESFSPQFKARPPVCFMETSPVSLELGLVPLQASRKFPITEMQLCLIHGSHRRPGTNIITRCETYSPNDIPLLKQAWKAVIKSEPIFRTSFHIRNGEEFFVEEDEAVFSWSETVVRDQDSFDTAIKEESRISHIGTSFDVVTLQIGDVKIRSAVLWRIHHTLIDGYSYTLLFRKLQKAALGLPLPAGPSFGFLTRGLAAIHMKSRSAAQIFWKRQKEQFVSAKGKLALPSPAVIPSSGAVRSATVTLRASLSELVARAHQTGITLPTLYHAAWSITLSIYTDCDTVVFGVVLSGRNLPLNSAEDTIGPLINTLPFNISLEGSSTTSQLMEAVFSHLIRLNEFSWSKAEDGFDRNFSSILSMQFANPPATDMGGPVPVEQGFSTMISDCDLNVLIDADGKIKLQYNPDVYENKDIEHLGEMYRSALLMLLEPSQSIRSCMSRVHRSEFRHDLLKLGNCDSKLSSMSSVHDDLVTLFEKVVIQNPNAVALQQGSQSLTYAGLEALANVVANHLIWRIRPGEVVAVHATRSINWIIAIYGVIKAGGVYCPFDETLPASVRDANFGISGGKIFINPGPTDTSVLPTSCECHSSVEEILANARFPEYAQFHNRIMPQPETNAYLCFTSGSTGEPKGVLCSHGGLVAFQKDLEIRLFARPGWKIAQIMSPAFDGSIHEIFSALSYGATLILKDPQKDLLSSIQLADAVVLTPSFAKVLDPENFPHLSKVYLVGEVVTQAINDHWSRVKTVYNMFGPTEATCGATTKKLSPGQAVTIGTPNPSTRIYILDRCQTLVPRGVIGEIYLAGVQISRGYVGRESETRKSFMPDSICSHLHEPMYKTGDRGFWNQQGEIVYMGRNDRQLKLRGFRLDLDDLEVRILNAIPGLSAIALTFRNQHLVALVQPDSLNMKEVKSKIAKTLPPYALPKHIVAVSEFPMTRAGKLDYQAFPEELELGARNPSQPFLNESQQNMAVLWRDILQLVPETAISKDSNFHDLGGNSIQQLQLASRLQIRLPLIVDLPILGELVEAMEGFRPPQNLDIAIQSSAKLGESELSPIEREWWQKYQLDEATSAFNVTFACNLDESIQQDGLAAAWNLVLARHQIFRCRYVADFGRDVRRTYSEHPPSVLRVEHFDLHCELNRPFDLVKDDPIRVILSPSRMAVVISHIMCDLTALQLILQEVTHVYNGSSLPNVLQTYMKTTLWSTVAKESDLNFWSDYLAKAPDLKYSFQIDPGRKNYTGHSSICLIPERIFEKMASFVRSHKVTYHQLALSAVALALQSKELKTDILLGAPYLNRMTCLDQETVGLFLEPLPIRIIYPEPQSCLPKVDSKVIASSSSSATSFVQAVRRCSQAALTHAVPWNQLLKHLHIAPNFPRHPLLDIMVTFHDHQQAPKLPLRGVEPLYTWTEGAKFTLMVEFLAVSGKTLLMRMEHDPSCFDEGSLGILQQMITEALDGIVKEQDIALLKTRLAYLATGKEACELGSSAPFFGCELSSL